MRIDDQAHVRIVRSRSDRAAARSRRASGPAAAGASRRSAVAKRLDRRQLVRRRCATASSCMRRHLERELAAGLERARPAGRAAPRDRRPSETRRSRRSGRSARRRRRRNDFDRRRPRSAGPAAARRRRRAPPACWPDRSMPIVSRACRRSCSTRVSLPGAAAQIDDAHAGAGRMSAEQVEERLLALALKLVVLRGFQVSIASLCVRCIAESGRAVERQPIGVGASASPQKLCTLTPSSRTGRRPASVLSSRCTARAVSVGFVARRRRGVAARDRREVGVADLDRDRAREQLPARRASATACGGHLGDLGADRVEVGQVLGIGVLGARRLRLAVRHDRPVVDAVGQLPQPVGQAADRLAQQLRVGRRGRRRAARCRARAACCAVTGPTPHSASTGSCCRNGSTRSGLITVRPSGFFQPDAIFARNLFGATPADAVSPVSARMRAFSRCATVRRRAARPTRSR